MAITHYGLFRESAPGSPMIKTIDLFRQQNGLTDSWGESWEPIEDAASIGGARRIFAKNKQIKLSFIYDDEE